MFFLQNTKKRPLFSLIPSYPSKKLKKNAKKREKTRFLHILKLKIKKVQKTAVLIKKTGVQRCRHVGIPDFFDFSFSKTDGKPGLVKNEIVKMTFFDTLLKTHNLTRNQ